MSDAIEEQVWKHLFVEMLMALIGDNGEERVEKLDSAYQAANASFDVWIANGKQTPEDAARDEYDAILVSQ